MNKNYTISTNGEVFCKCPTYAEGVVTIPEGILAVRQNAFRGCEQITSVRLPTTLKKIGSDAFKGCILLESINLPDSVEYIGKRVFKGCRSMQTIKIPSALWELPLSTFDGCHGLKNVNIPSEGLKYIDDNCFRDCFSLTKIDLPLSIISVGKAFMNCMNLKTINMILGHVEVKKNAFEQCNEELTIGGVSKAQFFKDFNYQRKAVKRRVLAGKILSPYSLSLKIDDALEFEAIEAEAYKRCTGLEEMKLSKTVKVIDISAFEGCSNLSRLKMEEGLEIINKNAFRGCSSLTSLHLPNSLKRIEAHAFEGCLSITNVSISPNTFVDKSAFDVNDRIKITYRQ